MGVSIVRENRELLLDTAFVREGGRGEDPMNRWWGAEVRFGKGLDDLFGVDHNKQMAAAITNAAKELINSDEPIDVFMDDEDVRDDPVYQIVAHIHQTANNMLSDVQARYAEQREARRQDDDASGTAKKTAERLATTATEDDLSAGGTPTRTDIQHGEDPDTRAKAIASHLEQEGVPAEDAGVQAAQIVASELRFEFRPKQLSGYVMFEVRSVGGTLFVNLNINHPLYEFLQFLEQRDDEAAHTAAVAIRVLLLAWARMEDQTGPPRIIEVQDFAMRWGRQASDVLSRLGYSMEPEGA
jgi:hypothetical protein